MFLENFLANFASEFIVGILAVAYLTRYFEAQQDKKSSIAFLKLIRNEISLNKFILKGLKTNGINAFEEAYHRDKITPANIFEDAAAFLAITTDSLLSNVFYSNSNKLMGLNNHELIEEIMTLYMNDFHMRIQTSFRMKQLNWALLDQIKSAIEEITTKCGAIEIRIDSEIVKISKERSWLKAVAIWKNDWKQID